MCGRFTLTLDVTKIISLLRNAINTVDTTKYLFFKRLMIFNDLPNYIKISQNLHIFKWALANCVKSHVIHYCL